MAYTQNFYQNVKPTGPLVELPISLFSLNFVQVFVHKLESAFTVHISINSGFQVPTETFFKFSLWISKAFATDISKLSPITLAKLFQNTSKLDVQE